MNIDTSSVTDMDMGIDTRNKKYNIYDINKLRNITFVSNLYYLYQCDI